MLSVRNHVQQIRFLKRLHRFQQLLLPLAKGRQVQPEQESRETHEIIDGRVPVSADVFVQPTTAMSHREGQRRLILHMRFQPLPNFPVNWML